MTRRIVLLVVLTASLAACGGGGSSPPPVSCKPAGTHLSITAKNNLFDETCLAAPANHASEITLRNEDDGVVHNIQVFTGDGSSVFKGALVTGVTTVTYHLPSLRPGTYTFHCDVHPDTMKGTFVVK